MLSGDEIQFQIEDSGKITFKKKNHLDLCAIEDIDQDFLDGIKDLFDNYDQTLRNLVDR